MSRFDLRDVSARLTRSRDTKAVVFEFLRSLEAARTDWRASLAFYEVSRDAFVDVFEVEGNRLIRREIVVSGKDLPQRLVRKLFDASAIFNAHEKPSLFSSGLGTAPYYVAEARDAPQLLPLTVISEWRSCICMPLGDQSDLMAILVITSAKKNAFGGRAVSEILPVKSLVTVALAKHLRRAGLVAPALPAEVEATPAPAEIHNRAVPVETETAAPVEIHDHATPIEVETAAPVEIHDDATPVEVETAAAAGPDPAAEIREQIEDLAERSRHADSEEPSEAEALANLTEELEQRQLGADEYRFELERVKSAMAALEAQSSAATEYLSAAYGELNEAGWKTVDLERRVSFVRRFLGMLGQEPDGHRLPMTVVEWLTTELGIGRCSLMTLDADDDVLRISAQCGIDIGVAASVRVRVGQGVAGWVAHNRKPLLVRMRSQAEITPEDQADTYNSPSFIAVPVVHNGRLYGVLNFSNKQGGELFTGVDFDCASLAGAALAVRLATCEPQYGVAARAA